MKGGLVGVFAVVVLAYITFNTLSTEGLDQRGLGRGAELPPFAVPLAASAQEDQDANVNARREGDVPAACDVRGADVLNLCELAEQGPFVLVLVVTEAGDCADQLDVLERVAPRYPRVRVAAVAVRDDLDDLKRRLRGRRWRVPLGYDADGAVGQLYGLGTVCPLFTFADADGRVAGTHVGALDERALAERIERLLLDGRGAEPAGVRGKPLDQRLLIERQWLDDVGTERIGAGYGCAVVTPRRRPREDPRLTIFVSDAAAAERARSLGARLSEPRRVRVRSTSPRFALRAMRAIHEDVLQRLPQEARHLSLGLAGFPEVRDSDCPPLVIRLQPAGHNAASVERWARDSVRRHGEDRVVLKRRRGRIVFGGES